MWEAVEIQPSVYNTTYFDEIETLINDMGEKGIYTMVDAHQDVVARITCGEGIPDFYAKKVIQGAKCTGDWSQPEFDDIKLNFGDCTNMDDYGYEKDENDWPLVSECNKQPFWKYYTSAESLAIFDALYTNKHGLTDAFVGYWDAVAKRFSKNKYVIGFDPINEPFPAGFEENTSIITDAGVFDKEQLTPLYEKVFERLIEADPNTIMYFEPGQFPDAYLGKVKPTGFEKPPGG